MKTLKEHQKAQEIELEQAREAAEEQHAFLQFFRKHPELNCTANEIVFREFHHGEPVTLQSLEESAPFLTGKLAVLSNEKVIQNAQQTIAEHNEAVAAENARRKSLSSAELKALIQSEQPQYGQPALPEEWIPPGKKKAIELTRENILQLAKVDYPAYKALYARFGHAAINKRLGVQPTTQPGQRVRIKI